MGEKEESKVENPGGEDCQVESCYLRGENTERELGRTSLGVNRRKRGSMRKGLGHQRVEIWFARDGVQSTQGRRNGGGPHAHGVIGAGIAMEKLFCKKKWRNTTRRV